MFNVEFATAIAADFLGNPVRVSVDPSGALRVTWTSWNSGVPQGKIFTSPDQFLQKFPSYARGSGYTFQGKNITSYDQAYALLWKNAAGSADLPTVGASDPVMEIPPQAHELVESYAQGKPVVGDPVVPQVNLDQALREYTKTHGPQATGGDPVDPAVLTPPVYGKPIGDNGGDGMSWLDYIDDFFNIGRDLLDGGDFGDSLTDLLPGPMYGGGNGGSGALTQADIDRILADAGRNFNNLVGGGQEEGQLGGTVTGMAWDTDANQLTDEYGRPTVRNIEFAARAKCPSGYVAVTNPGTGSRMCMLKRVAIAEGLYKNPPKPPITAADMRSIQKATRARRRIDAVQTKARSIGKKAACR